MSCEVQRNDDGSYTIRALRKDIAAIAKYQRLPRCWQIHIDHLIDSMLTEVEPRRNNVVQLPARRPA